MATYEPTDEGQSKDAEGDAVPLDRAAHPQSGSDGLSGDDPKAPAATASTSGSASAEQSTMEFPPKMRIHALARLLGVTSKDVIKQLGKIGITARSAQSSVDRDSARRVRSALHSESHATDDSPSINDAHAAETALPKADERSESNSPLFSSIETQLPAVSSNGADSHEQSPLFIAPDPVARHDPRRRSERSERPDRQSTGKADTSGQPQDESLTEPSASSAERTVEGVDDAAGTHAAEDARGNRRRRRGRRGRGRNRPDTHDGGTTDSSDKAAETPNGGADNSGDGADRDTAPSDPRLADADEKMPQTPRTSSENDQEKAPEVGGGGDDSFVDATIGNADADGKAPDVENPDSDDDGGSPSSKRRRRRRRRRSGNEESGGEEATSEDDPPNTVVHEREPRSRARRDEVQGISGSTRLEAKRQRRRDGRDAGRRRPPILSESEFLARREAVDRVMVVREKDRSDGNRHEDYTQVGVLEDGVLVEHFVTTSSSTSMVGNIYLGKVQNVLPSMEAAFVDIGRGRNGVLYAGEVNWDAAGLDGNSRKIEQALKPGDQVLVQVSKDPIGHKGARLTTQISLAGRFLVFVPGGSSTGISRKLPDNERRRLKDILKDILPDDAGVIIRTASEGVSADELTTDINRLRQQWADIEAAVAHAKQGGQGTGARALYEEPDLLVKVVRDLFNEDFSKLVVEGDRAWATVQSYVKTVAPDLLPRLERYNKRDAGVDVFAAYRIDEQLAKALDRKVWLPSGGTLIIERTEAMTVVDVNTGKFTGAGGNLEETVTRNNLEAAEEIVRQMRLRDIGGMIIVDFIDMVLESNRDLVLRRLTEALGRDRTRHQVSEVTSLGLVQMTRKRLGTGLLEAFSTCCTHCNGRGVLVHADPIEVRGASESDGNGSKRRDRRKNSEDAKSGEDKRVSDHAGDGSDTAEQRGDTTAESAEASNDSRNGRRGKRTRSKRQVNPSEHPMFKTLTHHDDSVADETVGTSVPEIHSDALTTGDSGDALSPASVVSDSAFLEEAGSKDAVSKEAVSEKVVSAEVPSEETQPDLGQSEQTSDDIAPLDSTPKRRRSRRASRPTSASSTSASAMVISVPVAEASLVSNGGHEGADATSRGISSRDVVAESEMRPTDSIDQGSDLNAATAVTNVAPAQRRPRRRAAARPAGPPAVK